MLAFDGVGFDLDIWDYLTFAVLLAIAIAAVVIAINILALPGKIALSRKHPDAEAVNLMGWAGALAVVPWIQAFIWAFKPTEVVDVRRLPEETQQEIEKTIARLVGEPAPARKQDDKGPAPTVNGQTKG